MSLYVDASAFLKRYVEEDESDMCASILAADTTWITARLTWIEVHRNLARLLRGRDRARMEEAFRADWQATNIVELDRAACERAADIAVTHGVRSLDAIHLAAALRVGATGMTFLTFDLRQAQAARGLGLVVAGG